MMLIKHMYLKRLEYLMSFTDSPVGDYIADDCIEQFLQELMSEISHLILW